MGTPGRKWGKRKDPEPGREWCSGRPVKPLPRARSDFHRRKGHIRSEIARQAIDGTFDLEVMTWNLACAKARAEKGRGLTCSEYLEIALTLGYTKQDIPPTP